jgi:hypothetical protein
MKRKASELKLDKPVIIGEFSTECSETKNATKNFEFAYQSGYSGKNFIFKEFLYYLINTKAH